MPNLPVTNIVARIVFGQYDLFANCNFEYDYKKDRIVCAVNINEAEFLHLGQNIKIIKNAQNLQKPAEIIPDDQHISDDENFTHSPEKFDKNEHYILIPELPEEEQIPFLQWLHNGKMKRPAIREEGTNQYNCAWKWDYEIWKKENERK